MIKKHDHEEKTTELVRNYLKRQEFTEKNYFCIEEYTSDNPMIDQLLKNASKSGVGVGKPDFIITYSKSNLIIIIEAKPKNHDKAEREAVHYASYISKQFDVLALAISGETSKDFKVTTYYWKKGNDSCENINVGRIAKFSEYQDILLIKTNGVSFDKQKVMKCVKQLNEDMRDYAAMSNADKSSLFSGILIALKDENFRNDYNALNSKKEYKIPDTSNFPEEILTERLLYTIKSVLVKQGIPAKKIDYLTNYYKVAIDKEVFKKVDLSIKINPLRYFIIVIHQNIFIHFDASHSFDIMGSVYSEFLNYGGGDEKNGIVITPHHITDLFCELAKLNPKSKVVDICTGTGGFLISAMKYMIDKANFDEALIEDIKANNLIGIEKDEKMYSLAVANMILRKDGQSHLYHANCFDDDIFHEVKMLSPNAAFINPPYALNDNNQKELCFVERMLDLLTIGGTGIAIVPLSCAINPKGHVQKMKKQILTKHTLIAVMTMPEDLFQPTVGTNTCIMIFEAHKPHNSEIETWFGYWRNDGYELTSSAGRIDINNKWEGIKDTWIKAYHNRKEIPGLSLKKSITATDEWCAEAYMETDYNTITQSDFERELRKYAAFRLLEEMDGEIGDRNKQVI